MAFTITIPFSLEWLVGLTIDNLCNMLAAIEGERPRYTVEHVNDIPIITVSLPDKAYDDMLSLAKSQRFQSLARKCFQLVDGFLIKRILREKTVQDLIVSALSQQKAFINSVNTVRVEFKPSEHKLVVTWGSDKSRLIRHEFTPFPLRYVEFLEGARVTCPTQLDVKERVVRSGFRIEFNIDRHVYALVALATLASTINLAQWPPRTPRTIRAIFYRLTGYDTPRILAEIAESAKRGEWMLFRNLLGDEDCLGVIFHLDRERGLQTPEVLVVHYIIAAFSRYTTAYSARLDIILYKHERRSDIDLYMSIHLDEYSKLLTILSHDRRLAERYMKLLCSVARKYLFGSEDEKRAASLAVELVYLLDKVARDVASPSDVYAIARNLQTYFTSKHYRIFRDQLLVFQDIIKRYMAM